MLTVKKRLLMIVLSLFFFLIYREQKLHIKKILFQNADVKNLSVENKLYYGDLEPPFVLSFSLFGNNWSSYKSVVERVAASAMQSNFYKNWSVRLYHDGMMLNKDFVNILKKKYTNFFSYNVNFLSEYGNVSHINGRAWRFLAAGDSNVEVMCSRDLDSPFLEREEDAVREWLKSDKLFHVMRDHPMHSAIILGGTWCFKNKNTSSLGKTIAKLVIEKSANRSINNEAPKENDQYVLANYIWPLIKNDVLQNDAYLCNFYDNTTAFPSKRSVHNTYVGMIGNIPVKKMSLPACPLKCRPEQHQDWEFC